MKQAINAFISRHKLLTEGDHLLLAVSGGSDSMAMLRFFQDMSVEWNLVLSVTHVEHGLRGTESKRDEELVRSYCNEAGISCYVFEADVKKKQKQDGTGTQEAARACRYEWFDKLMHKLEADKLVMAHHGDDQIETVLMRQIRGSLSGRKGIPVKRPFACGELIRPFLAVEKQDLVSYCRNLKVPYREDSSNNESVYQRNRIRKEMLSFIKDENPKAHTVFQWQSEVWAEEDDYLEQEASRYAEEVILSQDKESVTISLTSFLKVPHPLQRRIIHLILNYLSKDGAFSLSRLHTDGVERIMNSSHPSARIKLPGSMAAERSYNTLLFTANSQPLFKPADSFPSVELPVPGEVSIPFGSIRAAVSFFSDEDVKADGAAWFDLDQLALPLKVRTRGEGDRMSLYGGGGTKKLKDLFINAKVSKRDRDLWPIVTDSRGTILWVPFLKRSNEAVVSGRNVRALRLTCHIYT